MAAVIERLEDHIVGPGIQLLHLLAVYIPLVRAAQDVDQAGHVHFARNHLRRERNVVQQIAERTARLRILALLLDDVALDGNHGA
jgi:hypothetical protein